MSESASDIEIVLDGQSDSASTASSEQFDIELSDTPTSSANSELADVEHPQVGIKGAYNPSPCGNLRLLRHSLVNMLWAHNRLTNHSYPLLLWGLMSTNGIMALFDSVTKAVGSKTSALSLSVLELLFQGSSHTRTDGKDSPDADAIRDARGDCTTCPNGAKRIKDSANI